MLSVVICYSFVLVIATVCSGSERAFQWMRPKHSITHLKLVNDGPVVWGSNITFDATLSGVFDVPFVWKWEDEEHTVVVQHANLRSQLVKSYDKPGNFTMKVTVMFLIFKVATATNTFRISPTIPGELEVYEGDEMIPPGHYISTGNETHFYTKLYDPGGFLQNATILYWWYIDSILVDNRLANLTYNFTSARDYKVLIFVNAYKASEILRWASFNYMVRARDPILTINATGNTLLKRGDIVDLNIECDGSSPWVYCWNAIDNDNATLENMSCSNMMTTNDCEFRTIWYFEHTGHHKILINISNDINRKVRIFGINILNGVPEAQLSTIIIPIVGSLLAVTIIVMGLFYFIQTRHRLTIEVADFDFTSTDSLVYRTFFEQLKDAIVDALPHSSYALFERNWNFLDCCVDQESATPSIPPSENQFEDSVDSLSSSIQ